MKKPDAHGDPEQQVLFQIEHLKRTVPSPADLVEHIIQLYGAEFEKANACIDEQRRANDELFRIKQKVVIANRELRLTNGELATLIGRVVNELPNKRDWLDPDLEKMLRAAAKQYGKTNTEHAQPVRTDGDGANGNPAANNAPQAQT